MTVAADPTETSPEAAHRRTFRIVLGVMAGMIVLPIAGFPLVAGRIVARHAAPAEPLPVIREVPDFLLTERSGATVARSELLGKVWVADFIFAHCAGPCPIMSERMKQVQDAVADAGLKDVRCVSITVDPRRDTPSVLSQYADRYGADPERWLFLTGDKDAIFKLAIDGFGLGVVDENEIDPILHSTRFVLVDRRGRIRGYYDAAVDDPRLADMLEVPAAAEPGAILRRLLADIRNLAREDGR